VKNRSLILAEDFSIAASSADVENGAGAGAVAAPFAVAAAVCAPAPAAPTGRAIGGTEFGFASAGNDIQSHCHSEPKTDDSLFGPE
jgi:hypothetical protein